MRRRLNLLCVVALISLFVLIGCSNSGTGTVTELIGSYYKSYQPFNKGELKIIAQKMFNDKTLVLAEKYSGDGHGLVNLFVISNDNKVVYRADGQYPLSMCFSANVIELDNKTIVFGNFNNSKWDPITDIKKPVDIKNVLVTFNDGEKVKENVGKAYIIFSTNKSVLKNIELYNDNGQLQSDLNEIGGANNTQVVDLAK